MNATLITAGVVCVIAAIVGGGLKAFRIELPVVHSLARQIALGVFGVVLLAVPNLHNLHGLSIFHKNCLTGDWQEAGNPSLVWRFEQSGENLAIRRLDNFVNGRFSKRGDTWVGNLDWGNGDKWNNVILSPTQDCTEVKTNQAWSYRRK